MRVSRDRKFLTVVVLMLAGCAAPVTSSPTPISTIAPATEPLPTAVVNSLPRRTPTETAKPTLAATNTLTVAETQSSRYISRCASQIPANGRSLIKTGQVIYEFGPDYWSLSAASAQPSKLPVTDASIFEVSPFSGTMLWDVVNNKLAVQTADGNQKQIPMDPDWGAFRQWLTKDRVVFDVYQPARYQYQEPFPAIETYYLLDLATGNALKRTVQFADQFAVNFRGNLNKWQSFPVYDPGSASKAIYVWHKPNGYDGLSLWDISAARSVWSEAWHGPDNVESDAFAWNNDGTEAMLVSNTIDGVAEPTHPELWLVSDTGNARRLTELGSALAAAYAIVSPTWSPDGKHIAFLISSDQYVLEAIYTGTIAVIDLDTQVVTDYCVGPVKWSQGLVWSPDSQHLAFITQTSQLTVLDVTNSQFQIVYHMPNNFDVSAVEGWIANAIK
jgi:hypothetical protein